jgi:leader peptidase (prepilin peptidase)/N-methyltransferase
MGTMDPFLASASVVLGLVFGSFLNVCIYRLPRDLSVLRPRRSSCPNCKQQIAFYDNLPVLSWLFLRGRCRKCNALISPRYLLVEVLTAILFLACAWYFGMTLAAQFLPDVVSLPVSSDISSRLLSLADSLLGALVGASFIYGAGAIYLRARGVEGMGFGDVKLMAMIGAFLGVKLTIFTIFTASIAGSLFGVSSILMVWIKRKRRFVERRHLSLREARQRAWHSAQTMYRHYEMPFGVFLGSMAMVAFFFGKQFLAWYWRLL